MTVLTIYDRPADHPRHVVLVSWWADADGLRRLGEALCDTVEQARAIPLAAGMTRVERDPSDDPVVVESWI